VPPACATACMHPGHPHCSPLCWWSTADEPRVTCLPPPVDMLIDHAGTRTANRQCAVIRLFAAQECNAGPLVAGERASREQL